MPHEFSAPNPRPRRRDGREGPGFDLRPEVGTYTPLGYLSGGGMNEVPVVTSPKIEQLKSYVQANRGKCNDCGMPIWWASTAKGKRIPMDFGNYMTEKTHQIVMGYSEGGTWDGSVEAWPADSQATHTCHLDTCDKRLVEERHSHGGVQNRSGGTTHSHAGGNEPHDHDHGSYVGPGANWSKS